VFERFTERARQVVVLAQEETRLLKHRTVGTEHLLLGLVRDDEGVAGQALAAVGIGLDPARAAVATAHAPEDNGGPRQIPFTPGAKYVLERSLREAVRMGHNYVGSEHLLLGLLRAEDATGHRVMLDLGAEPETLRELVLELVAQRPERRQLPYAPDVAAALARAVELARDEGAEQVELDHLRQVLEGS
jgi:ATP-dependent Clp protease ATP-binding subunit ClpC